MMMIYVAHAFGGNLENADKAERWTAWLNEHIKGAIFICPWLPMVRYWVDSGESRKRGLQLDVECVLKCDALIAIGPVSPGMQLELDAAREKLRVFDPMPVAWSPEDVENIQSWVDSIVPSGRAEMCDDISLIAQEWATAWHDIEGDVETAASMRRICDVIGTTYGGEPGSRVWGSNAPSIPCSTSGTTGSQKTTTWNRSPRL